MKHFFPDTKTTWEFIAYLLGLFSFIMGFSLFWSGVFWQENSFSFWRIIFSWPFLGLGVFGLLIFVRSPFFSDQQKQFFVWFMYASTGLLLFWLLMLTDFSTAFWHWGKN